MSSKSPPNFGTVQTWPAHSVKEKVKLWWIRKKDIFWEVLFLVYFVGPKKIKPTVIKQSMCWYIVDWFISEHCTDQSKTSVVEES